MENFGTVTLVSGVTRMRFGEGWTSYMGMEYGDCYFSGVWKGEYGIVIHLNHLKPHFIFLLLIKKTFIFWIWPRFLLFLYRFLKTTDAYTFSGSSWSWTPNMLWKLYFSIQKCFSGHHRTIWLAIIWPISTSQQNKFICNIFGLLLEQPCSAEFKAL